MKNQFVKDNLHCPYCLSSLSINQMQLACNLCQRTWLIKNGIPQLQHLQIDDFPSGELSNALSHKLVNLAEEKDWLTAMKIVLGELSEPVRSYFEKYVTNQYRSSFSLLLDLDTTSRVLDYGCGWGLISCSLAARVGEVVSIDLALNRARYTAMRSKQMGYSNVSVFCAGDTPHLPFPDGFFDIVILNGVLEWFPTFIEGHPGRIQLEKLKEINRVLKKNGQLFLAIENRFWIRYWFGYPEVHTLQRWIPLMPRGIGRVVSRLTAKKDFRVWTYSLRGYQKLLSSAGFRDIKSFEAMPEYNFPEEIIPLGSLAARINSKWDKFLKHYLFIYFFRIFSRFSFILDKFVYTYWFIGKK